MAALTDVLLLYNTDYDDELIAASDADVSAVREAAEAVEAAARDAGLGAELVGVHGRDLDGLFARLRDNPPQLVFNLVESLNGTTRNEGVLPSVLDMLSIPYTGPGPLAIGLSLHKDRAKQVLSARGIDTPDYVVIESEADIKTLSDSGRLSALAYPFFLKLAREDASIGIEASNVVHTADELCTRARAMLEKHNQPVLGETYIDGREVNITVIGNGDDIGILPLHEISFAAMPDDRPHIVSYAAKWDENHVDYEGTKPVPMADVSPELAGRLESVAIATFRAFGLCDFGRVDVRIDEHEIPWVIDVNPNCDLSPDAGVARAARHGGTEYPQLVRRICELAWRRYGH